MAALVDRACAGGKPRRPYAGLELDVDVPVGDGIVDVAEAAHDAHPASSFVTTSIGEST